MMNLVLAAQSAQGSGMSMIIMMVAIFAIMWNTVDVKIARDVVITVDKNYVFKDVTSTPMQK